MVTVVTRDDEHSPAAGEKALGQSTGLQVSMCSGSDLVIGSLRSEDRIAQHTRYKTNR